MSFDDNQSVTVLKAYVKIIHIFPDEVSTQDRINEVLREIKKSFTDLKIDARLVTSSAVNIPQSPWQIRFIMIFEERS